MASYMWLGMLSHRSDQIDSRKLRECPVSVSGLLRKLLLEVSLLRAVRGLADAVREAWLYHRTAVVEAWVSTLKLARFPKMLDLVQCFVLFRRVYEPLIVLYRKIYVAYMQY